MKTFRSFIDSDTLGAGSFQHRLFFECDLSEQGPDGDVTCWDVDGHFFDFNVLPSADQLSIVNACLERVSV